jgi:two-component system, OmpR family, response regulator
MGNTRDLADLDGERTSGVTDPELLLVDDDRALVDVLGMALQDAGFAVRTAHDGKAGWEAFRRQPPQLVVLDLLMPELDGLQLCKLIREGYDTPVIMLTSRDEEMDKVLGLEMGADDYVTKPFSTRELVARTRAALRRGGMRGSGQSAEPPRQRGPLRMDRGRREVRLHQTRLKLTATEFELLWTLTEEPGQVCSRRQIIDRVYGEDIVVSDRTIDTFVKRLRRKLAEIDASYLPIETVRSVGYRFQG